MTIGELVFDTTITLPIIAEVTKDYCDGSVGQPPQSFQKGDLLWLVQLAEDDEGCVSSVEASRWEAPDFVLSLPIKSKLTFSQKRYSTVLENISFGPVLDISGLANLAKDQSCAADGPPVYGLAHTENDGSPGGKAGLLAGFAPGDTGRIVVHGKEQITGFLVQGLRNPLMIPGGFEGVFVKVSVITVSIN